MKCPAASHPVVGQESVVKCRCKRSKCQTKIESHVIRRWIRRVQCLPPCPVQKCRGTPYSGLRRNGRRMNKWPSSISSPRVVNIEDLRVRARRRLPRAVFDYLDGGAET